LIERLSSRQSCVHEDRKLCTLGRYLTPPTINIEHYMCNFPVDDVGIKSRSADNQIRRDRSRTKTNPQKHWAPNQHPIQRRKLEYDGEPSRSLSHNCVMVMLSPILRDEVRKLSCHSIMP
jgi:hypothetical protein